MSEAIPSSAHFSTAQSARCVMPVQATATSQRGPCHGTRRRSPAGMTSAEPLASTATMCADKQPPSPSNSSTPSPAFSRKTRVACLLSSALKVSRPVGSGAQ